MTGDYAASFMQLDPQGPGEAATASVCSGSHWKCHAHELVTPQGHIQSFAAPQGFGPADLQAAYLIPSITTHPTVVIIDAFGYSKLASDLATYRSQYGLPVLSACPSTTGPCLSLLNQNGQPVTAGNPADPTAQDDWTVETALDVDMVSAACPSCNITVVETNSDQDNGLFIANNTAASLHPTVVSNSWGGPEQAGSPATANESYFNHPGIAVFVSAGDDGYNDGGQGPDYPGTSDYVIAVGGTHLVKDASARGWTETVWSTNGAGGSACSLSIPKPSYQTQTACQYRASTDIAAVGDPATGVAVYNTENLSANGWIVVGGTSAASPLVASIFAATGNGDKTAAFVAQNASKLYDVTSGTNGTCGTILCTAGPGWDGPSGYGTPNAQQLAAMGNGSGQGSGTGSGGGGGNGNGGGSGSSGGGGGGGGVDGTPGGGGTGGNGAVGNDVVGGCAAGGSGAGLAMILAVGLIAVGRRRRA